MSTNVKTFARGQIVIPKEARKRLNIKSGQTLHVKIVEDHLEIYPLPEDPIKALRGIAKGGPSMAKELVKERKKEREREEKNSP